MISVGIGGFFGAITRYILGQWLTPKLSTPFPLTTWLINCSGSFALGLLVGLDVSHSLWLLFGTGFLGAYTTFSTFGYEIVQLLHQNLYRTAWTYIVTSVMLGFFFSMLGYFLI